MTAEQAFQQALALSKIYTKKSLLGGGAVAGKNVIISNIEPIEGGNRITFSYTLDDGTVQTSNLDVMDGRDGKGIPAEGTAGRVLAKKSDEDFDTEWKELNRVAFSGNYNDLSEIPKYAPAESGLYKITVDELGNVSSVIPVTKQDIVNLGIEAGYNFKIGSDGHLYVKPKS